MRIQRRTLQRICTALLGLLISLAVSSGAGNRIGDPDFSIFSGGEAIAQATRLESAQSSPLPATTEQNQEGQRLYKQGQFLAAIAQWQPLVQIYAGQNDPLQQASTLSNLALAYQQLGRWDQAQAAIAQSLGLITNLEASSQLATEQSTQQVWQVHAQALMAQGSVYSGLGQKEQALESWQLADENYTNSGDTVGAWRSHINQAQALRELGFYRQAQALLTSTLAEASEHPDSLLQATLLRRLGNMLQLTGDLSAAEQAFEQSLAIATDYNHAESISKALLRLGHIAQTKQAFATAQAFYEEATAALPEADTSSVISQRVAVELAQLALWVNTSNWAAVNTLWPTLQAQFAQLPPNQSSLYHQINWASSLIKANKQLIEETRGSTQSADDVVQEIAPWLTIARQLAITVEQAQAIADTRAESYAVGTLGQVYEQTQQWAIAQQQTQQALSLSQGKADIAYQWQWQLGRLWQASNNPRRSTEKSLAAYSQTVELLENLRGDLAGTTGNTFSFEENVEPIYRELVGLLLQTDPQSPKYQPHLAKAQDVIESLRLAELDNYFKEACIDIQPVNISQVDQNAAIIYSIVLDNHLSTILRLPGQPLQQFSTTATASQINDLTRELRQQLVIRSRRGYYPLAQQLYSWLVAPARSSIDSSGVDTLVFVLDGSLQNVPMAALYDGTHFLVEDYSIALTPGLKLLNPQPLGDIQLRGLIAGLTESRGGFSALPHVAQEVESIKRVLSRNTVLLNEAFTQQALSDKLKKDRYPIVHIATHGQFGSTPEKTYLLAWDEPIKVQDISQILQANLGDREATELLVLSACETASGDQQAALGLSGIAVKAGARSTLGSLWAINDEATARFIDYFYEQLTQPGATRASALRAAQLQLLRDPQYKEPIYWAPYILLGSWL